MPPDSFLDVLIQIVAFPFQLISFLVTTTLSFIFFDLFSLGA